VLRRFRQKMNPAAAANAAAVASPNAISSAATTA